MIDSTAKSGVRTDIVHGTYLPVTNPFVTVEPTRCCDMQKYPMHPSRWDRDGQFAQNLSVTNHFVTVEIDGG
jgi:hypothetical protein